MTPNETSGYLSRNGLIKLLEIKDADIRISTLEQCRDAIDRGIHVGGAFSATIPMLSLYYGGTMRYDVADPTRRGQDMFVLSKGHAVALLASVYADLGYFDRSVLKNSRGAESILNGHPGPILPGVHISTGPLGQGMGVAQGFAMVGKQNPGYDVYCLTGDGELQEGLIWEAVMFSSFKKLDNLCVLVDKNAGQLDDTRQLIFPMLDLDKRFGCFGWRVFNVDGTQYGTVTDALQAFKYAPREGKPTAIICRTRKGFGGFSNFTIGHKVSYTDAMADQEIGLQRQRRADRVAEFAAFYNSLEEKDGGERIREELSVRAGKMNLEIVISDHRTVDVRPVAVPVQTRRAPERNKKIDYDPARLPELDKNKEHAANAVITAAMKVFAMDNRVVSIDADLASTSGLEAGVGFVDVGRAVNVGVAEPNMMNIGEAWAAMGYNVWTSTFCPFFDWRVMRRIAIGYQERMETIAAGNGWLSQGHGLDITFVATAPNFETNTNGATHMGNDDNIIFDNIAHVKVIDVSCPNQLLGIMKWIMAGNKGLVYVRIMRAPSPVIYDADFRFEFGRGYPVRESPEDRAVIVSSGRGVHEALAAAAELESAGIKCRVVDMPSVDEKMLVELYRSGKPVVFAEQNNGYLWTACQRALSRLDEPVDMTRLMPVNVMDENGRPRFIHSATYKELTTRFGLSPERLAETVKQKLNGK